MSADAAVFEDALGIGFFLYGPRSWMLGEIEPLKGLRCDEARFAVIERILREYGSRTLTVCDKFYRIRKNPVESAQESKYDSPPPGLCKGRLGTLSAPALYASSDLQTCLHQCRVTAGDDLFMATLRPARDLELDEIHRTKDWNGKPPGDAFCTLAPTPELVRQANETGNYNDLSFVILHWSSAGRILLSGDSHDKTWEHVIANYGEYLKNVDLLIAAHHGRKSGRS